MTLTTHTIIAGGGDAGLRLDRFLALRLPDMSRSRLQALIAQGHVSSGATVTDSNAKVKPGQHFTLTIPEIVVSHIMAQDIALSIIYEDEHLLVIDKPAGLTVHPAPGHPDMTLVNALLAHCGASLSGIGGVARPGIVHRIDKDTSGLLVVAKHDTAHLHLSAQLAERTLKRTYLAVVWGKPAPAQGTITGNIGRSVSNRQKMAVVKSGGKPSVTHYKIIQHFLPLQGGGSRRGSIRKNDPHPALPLSGGGVSLVECNLETGRTHQIRVHLTHIGHPLVGDQTYGQPTKQRLVSSQYKSLPDETRAALLGFNRQALHARALELIHPVTGKKMRFECEIPDDISALIVALESY